MSRFRKDLGWECGAHNEIPEFSTNWKIPTESRVPKIVRKPSITFREIAAVPGNSNWEDIETLWESIATNWEDDL